jgi:MFS family permease
MLTVPTQRIITLGFVAFVLIGLEQGVLGLFVAELGTTLSKSPEDLGLFFALHGIGSAAVTGSALIGWLEQRNSKRIALSSLSLCGGSLLVVAGDYWLLKLIAAPLLGLGFGGLSMSFNTLFVTHFSQKNAGLLNVLNATYGLGAVAAPWLLSQGLLTGSELFIVIALASITVCVGAWNIDDRIPTRSSIAPEDMRAAPIGPLLMAAFCILFIEAGLTYWMPSLLSDQSGDSTSSRSLHGALLFLVRHRPTHCRCTGGLGFHIGFRCVRARGHLLFAGPCIGRHVPLVRHQFHGAFHGFDIPQCLRMDAYQRRRGYNHRG